MTPLSRAQIEVIDRDIDAAIGKLHFLQLPRDVALLQLLRHFEDFIRIPPPDTLSLVPPEAHRARWKAGQDAMQFAVNWIFQHNPSPQGKPRLDFIQEVFDEAGSYHLAAFQYSKVWDFMAILYGGRAVGERDAKNSILVSYPGPLEDYVDITAPFFSEVQDPNRTVPTHLASDPLPLLDTLNIKLTQSGQIKYSIPDEIFEKVSEYRFQQKASMWELDERWDLGGYTVQQFKQFWTALDASCWIHQQICFRPAIKDHVRRRNIIRTLQRVSWEKELARRSGLETRIVSKILDDLIYDPALYRPGKKQPDPTYQPFFPLSPTLLAVSNQLVYLSGAERNLWDLLSINRPKVHSELCNLKEEAWLVELTPRLQSYGLEVYGPINFNHHGKKSDIDILVMDRKLQVISAWQLKWLIEPDRFRDYKYTDDELKVGMNQAELSLDWLHSIPDRLRQLTGLDAAQLDEYEFQAMVVSKNTLASGWLRRKGIPVVTDKLIHWVLGKPHHRNLRTLWQIGEDRRYLPQAGKHFKQIDNPAKFGPAKFVGKDMGLFPLDSWDPSTDIDMTGIS